MLAASVSSAAKEKGAGGHFWVLPDAPQTLASCDAEVPHARASPARDRQTDGDGQ